MAANLKSSGCHLFSLCWIHEAYLVRWLGHADARQVFDLPESPL